mmetsp:Transcript_95085/g.288748  ORF Transcript_95085/g.288748 Transcript_95085/m.288748 type:complete len:432 (+) Transcript_95085:61-1356(+)
MSTFIHVWASVTLLLQISRALEGEHRLAVLVHNASEVLGGDGQLLHVKRFHDYMQRHGRTYRPGSEEYGKRLELFHRRIKDIDEHNSNPNRRWKATVNKLTDRTPDELKRLRGYKRHARHGDNSAFVGRQPAAFMSKSVRSVDMSRLPSDWSWGPRLRAMQDVRDQGSCGSCWAFASATVLRAYAELYQRDRTFSVQQMVSCTPNPHQCGGSGGCDGATAELAMDYVSRVGLSSDEQMQYHSRDGFCPTEMQMPKPTLRSLLRQHLRLEPEATASSNFGMLGWRKLPENRMEPIMLALYESGPVAASVMANDQWNLYGGGILDSCERDAVINHAVTLVGYGEDQGALYWTIQNSWGPEWGERGFVRLLRHSGQDENNYCGWDRQPSVGTGCKGGPPEVYVCGSCGVLYDTVVPTFRLTQEGWLARNGMQRL